jgi:hypothetical protein
MKRATIFPLILAALNVVSVPSGAQSSSPNNTTKQESAPNAPPALASRVPAPKPDDVKSFDAILHAIYDVISGPAGDRDWDRFRSLFVPEARLTSAQKNKDGSIFLADVEGYVKGAGGYFKTHGFYEHAIVNRVQTFGKIAQVFSSYESRNAPNEKPFARGVNSIQLFNDGSRWWVLSILWDEETPANPLPPDLATPAK